MFEIYSLNIAELQLSYTLMRRLLFNQLLVLHRFHHFCDFSLLTQVSAKKINTNVKDRGFQSLPAPEETTEKVMKARRGIAELLFQTCSTGYTIACQLILSNYNITTCN